MRKLLVFFIITGLHTILYSQITFEFGSFINNNDDTIYCFIKNRGWKYNPRILKYRIDSLGEVFTQSIADVKEFEIKHQFKYIRAIVEIDTSNAFLNTVSKNKYPEWSIDTVFLKCLIEGKASLYYYETRGLIRFFYSIDSKEIKQLVYKKYTDENGYERKNNLYMNQLINEVKCSGLEVPFDIKYTQKDLTNYFQKYNSCLGVEVKKYNRDKKKNEDLHLRLTIGLDYSNLILTYNTTIPRIYDFDWKASITYGLEAEWILPFNKNKWGAILEATSHRYYSKIVDNYYNEMYTMFNSYNLSAGVRYYVFLGKNSKLHINPNFVISLQSGSYVDELDVESIGMRPAFGLGYTYKDKFTLETKYYPKKDVLDNYFNYYTSFQSLSILFRFRFY